MNKVYRVFQLATLISLIGLVGMSTPSLEKAASPDSLKLVAQQGNTQAMFKLARLLLKAPQVKTGSQTYERQALYWLEKSLAQGYLPALFLLVEQYPHLESKWYQQAVRFQEINAMLYFWQQDKHPPEALIAQLSRLTQTELEQLVWTRFYGVLARFLLNFKDRLNHLSWQHFIVSNQAWRFVQLGDEVFKQGFTAFVEDAVGARNFTCDFSLSFVIPSELGRYPSYLWVGQLASFFNERGYRLCATEVALEPSEQLDRQVCQPLEGRAHCETLKKGLPETQASVMVYVTKQGTANTRDGRIYLSEQANWKLLLHELGHALGLADEYPMSKPLAEVFCSGNYQHPSLNLKIRPKQILYETQGAFIYPVETCLYAEGYQAYKSVSGATFMEFYESNLVPEPYLLWMKATMAQKSQL